MLKSPFLMKLNNVSVGVYVSIYPCHRTPRKSLIYVSTYPVQISLAAALRLL